MTKTPMILEPEWAGEGTIASAVVLYWLVVLGNYCSRLDLPKEI